jgi:competence protein ComEA
MAERLEHFDREQPAAPLIPAPAQERRAKATAPSAASPTAAAIGTSPGNRRAGPAPVAPTDPRPLDINRASLDELARLPGVGQSLAARILAERERRGRFESPDALRYVLGMGPKKLAAIRELIVVSSQ